MKILVINGPNINMLGVRERGIYGSEDYAALCSAIQDEASKLGIEADVVQSNVEGEMVGFIQGALGRYDESRGAMSTWLGAIARNVARRAWERRPRETEDFDPQLAEEVLADGPDPLSGPERQEELDALVGCIESLPADLARLVHLRFVEARTTRGIAQATGLPESTVRLRLADAQERLAACLGSKGNCMIIPLYMKHRHIQHLCHDRINLSRHDT
jgi:RNA polymerase sigma factor (sigma-70 family)